VYTLTTLCRVCSEILVYALLKKKQEIQEYFYFRLLLPAQRSCRYVGKIWRVAIKNKSVLPDIFAFVCTDLCIVVCLVPPFWVSRTQVVIKPVGSKDNCG